MPRGKQGYVKVEFREEDVQPQPAGPEAHGPLFGIDRIRFDAQHRPQDRFAGAGLLATLSFGWVTPLVKLGYQRPIDELDVPEAPVELQAAHIADEIAGLGEPKVGRLLWRLVRRNMFQAWAYQVCATLSNSFGPLLLSGLLTYLESDGIAPTLLPSLGQYEGWFFAAALGLSSLFAGAICQPGAQHQAITAGLRAKSAIGVLVYNKSLRLRGGGGGKDSSTGQVINLLSTDAEKLLWSAQSFVGIVTTPLQLVIAIALIINEIGLTAVVGIVVMVVCLWLMAKFQIMMRKFEKEKMEVSDSRIKLMNEILQGIKVVKYYAWEPAFLDRVDRLREEELGKLRARAWALSLWIMIIVSVPLWIYVIIFPIYLAIGGELTTAKVFTTMALFDMLRGPLMSIPSFSTNYAQLQVALERVRSFLGEPEVVAPQKPTVESDEAIVADNITFTFSPAAEAIKNANLKIKQGELVCVVGQIGSGKSVSPASFFSLSFAHKPEQEAAVDTPRGILRRAGVEAAPGGAGGLRLHDRRQDGVRCAAGVDHQSDRARRDPLRQPVRPGHLRPGGQMLLPVDRLRHAAGKRSHGDWGARPQPLRRAEAADLFGEGYLRRSASGECGGCHRDGRSLERCGP